MNFNTRTTISNLWPMQIFGAKFNSILPFFVTEMIHYIKLNTTISVDKNTMGDPQIEISTIDRSQLERSRQFEVKLTYSVPAPFISIQPDTVTITIKDRGGEYMHGISSTTCIPRMYKHWYHNNNIITLYTAYLMMISIKFCVYWYD